MVAMEEEKRKKVLLNCFLPKIFSQTSFTYSGEIYVKNCKQSSKNFREITEKFCAAPTSEISPSYWKCTLKFSVKFDHK